MSLIFLTLKSVVQKKEISEEESHGYNGSETLNLLTRKFGNCLKKRTKDINLTHKWYGFRKPESNSSNFTCFDCGK